MLGECSAQHWLPICLKNQIHSWRLTILPKLKTSISETAVIDNESNIDGTRAQDIIDAVTIGVQFYKKSASSFLSRIYIKTSM